MSEITSGYANAPKWGAYFFRYSYCTKIWQRIPALIGGTATGYIEGLTTAPLEPSRTLTEPTLSDPVAPQ